MVRNLSGDDAHNFIDVIDEVRTCTLSPLRNGSVDSHQPFCAPSIRRWIVSSRISAEGACTFYIIFVAA